MASPQSSRNSRGNYEVHSVFFSLLLIPATISAQDDPRCFRTDPSIAFSFPIPGHHIYNQTKSLAHEKMLKAGGEIVMIDFHKKELPIGPPMQMKIAREDLIKQMETNGFRLAKEHTFLPYQYFLVFVAK